MRQLVEEALADLRAASAAAPQKARAAFRLLLGDRRVRVGLASERGFRVEGRFEWSLEARRARLPRNSIAAEAECPFLRRQTLSQESWPSC